MSKADIYSESYTVSPNRTKEEMLETLKVRGAEQEHSRKLGWLLREERAAVQKLKNKLHRLEEENRRLKDSLQQKSR